MENYSSFHIKKLPNTAYKTFLQRYSAIIFLSDYPEQSNTFYFTIILPLAVLPITLLS